MKRKFLLSTLLLAVVPAFASDGLRVTHRNGDNVVFLFEQEPEISFMSDKLQIGTKGAGNPYSISLDDVDQIKFEKNLSSAEMEQADGIYFTGDAEGLHFHNVPAGTEVFVCDLTGKVLLNTKADTSGEFILRRSDYGSNTLVVKVGKLSAKVSF